MFKLLCRFFIPNYKDCEDEKVRERYGMVFSIFSISCNIVLVVFKFIVSIITNSISIRADALNNLSDVGSNLATLFGFKLANKHADADHPYGHGRIEYVSAMIVSFLILMMGFSSMKESATKIFCYEDIIFSYSAIVVLIVSICIKLLMAKINNKAGKAIKSGSLLAAGKDSLNDSLMTCATLTCLIIFKITNLNIDAYAGFVVSLFVIKSGINIFTDVLDTILGKAPDKEFLMKIKKTIMNHKEVLGIHDLMLHDYGPSHRFMSLHVEVDAKRPIIETHDIIDNIEMEILNKYNVLTTIHMDPIESSNKQVNELKDKVKVIVKSINNAYQIHDFRVVDGPSHTNIVFDVLLPADDISEIENLRETISNKIKLIDKRYNCVINFDRDYA